MSIFPPGGNEEKKTNDTRLNTVAGPGAQVAKKYKMHWHVLLVHFPISAFLGSFGFIILHLITQTSCFELSAFIALSAGTVVMIPTTITGWTTWKKNYKGYRSKIFLSKIRISFAMIAVSIIMIIYRSIFVTEVIDFRHQMWHVLFYIGGTLLFVGAVAEGYFGGRLNHR